jgi:hypothetical membrane protein
VRVRGLARGAIAGVVVYVAIDVALVSLRPHFSVLHNAESDYGSKGPYAWLMDVNFLLRCALSLAAVLALARFQRGAAVPRAGLGLLTTWAVASGLLSFFPDDPVGTTTHGTARVHAALAVIAFVAVVGGTRLTTRALRGDARWRPMITPLTVLSYGAIVPLLLLGRAHLRPQSLGGLYEKLFLAFELAWLLAASAWVARIGDLVPAEPASPVSRSGAGADRAAGRSRTRAEPGGASPARD